MILVLLALDQMNVMTSYKLFMMMMKVIDGGGCDYSDRKWLL